MLRVGCVVLVLLSALLAACSGEDERTAASGDDRVDVERRNQVAGDDGATAAEVVAAGNAVAADRAGDGSLLVAYSAVHADGHEVAQAAWRLYAPDGAVVAEEKLDTDVLGARVVGLEEGFLLAGVGVVDLDGTVTPVERLRRDRPMAATPGDLVVDDVDSTRLFRPQPPTLAPPLPAPRADSLGWAVGPDGSSWHLGLDTSRDTVAEVWREVAGSWRQVARVPLGPRQELLAYSLVPVGDRVVVPVVRRDQQDRVVVEALAVRRADAPLDEPWELQDPGPLARGGWDPDVSTFALDGTRFVLAGCCRKSLALDLDSGEWTPIGTPTPDEPWGLTPGRGGLFAFHDRHGAAYFSDDLGATWERLPR